MSKKLSMERCPHCRVHKPHLKAVTEYFITRDHSHGDPREWCCFACENCGGVVTAWWVEEDHFPNSRPTDPASYFPLNLDDHAVDAALPPAAKKHLEDAITSLHAQVASAASLLAASSVDAMLKGKGLKQGSLHERIETAAKQHLITDGMKEWAHQVRLEANAQRHADENEPPITLPEAKRCIEFTEALGKFLYTLPAMVQKGLNPPPPPVAPQSGASPAKVQSGRKGGQRG